MNEGYIIINNDTKVVVSTDTAYAKKVLDYNSNIKEILINENLIEVIDDRILSCDKTGKLLYKEYQKYLKFEKIDKTFLFSFLILFVVFLIARPIFNANGIFMLNTFCISGIAASILGMPVIRLLKKQMQTEVEKNAFKMEMLDHKKTELLKKNSKLMQTGSKKRVESLGSNIFEINHKKELNRLNEEVNKEINSTYEDTSKRIKRKVRMK